MDMRFVRENAPGEPLEPWTSMISLSQVRRRSGASIARHTAKRVIHALLLSIAAIMLAGLVLVVLDPGIGNDAHYVIHPRGPGSVGIQVPRDIEIPRY